MPKTERKMYVLTGVNRLLHASGPLAVAATKEALEEAAQATEYICDSQEIVEVSVWE